MTGEDVAEYLIRAYDRARLLLEARQARRDRIAQPRRPARTVLGPAAKPVVVSWRCDVCGTERPDAAIDVYSCLTDMRTGRLIMVVPPGTSVDDHGFLRTNVKYCGDRASCLSGAHQVYDRWIEPVRERVARLA